MEYNFLFFDMRFSASLSLLVSLRLLKTPTDHALIRIYLPAVNGLLLWFASSHRLIYTTIHTYTQNIP